MNTKLENNIQSFKRLEDLLVKKPTIENALAAVHFAIKNPCSVYYSEIVENFFMDLAEKTKNITQENSNKKPQKKSYLHVMTQCYLSGGHTRILERWIELSSNSEKHSLVLTNQKKTREIPNLLRNVIKEKKGDFISFTPSDSIENKANQLRNIAFSYDVIIMHHHMDDPIPLMAFSIKEFNRPVIVFNHAGHLFWLGRNISDFVVNIIKIHQPITKDKRGIANSMLIDMPVDNLQPYIEVDKKELRKKLGLPEDSKILISMSSEYKFNSIKNYNFTKTLSTIMMQEKNTTFVGIGIKENSPEWKDVKNKFTDRIKLLGVLPHNKIANYLRSADLYMDSFPYNSGLSLIDAINLGQLPALSLETPFGFLPFFGNSDAICKDVDTFISKTCSYIKDEKKLDDLYRDLKNRLSKNCSIEEFQKNIQKIIKKVKKIEKNNLRFLDIKDYICDLDIHKIEVLSKVSKKHYGIRYILEIEKIKNSIKKEVFLRVLGIKVIYSIKTINEKKVKFLFFPSYKKKL